MRHAILGAGGVGLAVGAALAEHGHEVVLVLREPARADHPGSITVHSGLHGALELPVSTASPLREDVDVLWVTVKAPALESALGNVIPDVSVGSVVSLLNGLDHLSPLRGRFGDRVVAGSIRIEAERTAPGSVTWHAMSAAVELAGDDDARLVPVIEALRGTRIDCVVGTDPLNVLWRKLAMLLPLALATTAADGPLGVVRRTPAVRELMCSAAHELCAVAATQAVSLSAEENIRTLEGLPGRTDTSLHRDVVAGAQQTELAALTDPVLRLATAHGVPTPSITTLVKQIRRQR
ncbi:2-dehydropantoate 2-reductase [Allokutzneria sp. A3M-2-11 16]|uniref:ketopantoate reductase family protein n=1 Tax=Allokutzneria sp. A3M-2-11 16 TaxID=2962043 RepID=UPI0020B7AF54|nr:2-dehydropantoate 2-reductase [Allokutzneria sp. A3M-2-11 16]MCP3803427.1 2-dehydropantoate 2-reductase [Allokutzneria sp. A3M-2-11 16]